MVWTTTKSLARSLDSTVDTLQGTKLSCDKNYPGYTDAEMPPET